MPAFTTSSPPPPVEPGRSPVPALVAAVTACALVAVGAWTLLDDGGDTIATPPATTVPPTTLPATTVPVTTVPVTTVPVTTVPVTTVPLAEAGPVPAAATATVRAGRIVLEGAVPDAASSTEVEALVAEVLGPQNVVNALVVDPRAPAPDLAVVTAEESTDFGPDRADIPPEAEGLLDQALFLLFVHPEATITVIGHTDDLGAPAANQLLSEARARAVVDWFVSRDVDPARLTAVGRGPSEPIATNDTPEGRRLNRRIQLVFENILG